MDVFEEQMYRKRRRQLRWFLCIPVLAALVIGIGIYVFTYHINRFCVEVTLQGDENILLEYGSSAVIVGLLLSIFSTILGHSIFSWCLKYFTPSFVSASKLCEPVAAAILACFLFAEYPKLMQLVGGILILGGVFYYSRLEREAE